MNDEDKPGGSRMVITQTRGDSDAKTRSIVEAQVARHGWQDMRWETVETAPDDNGKTKKIDRLTGWREHGRRGGKTTSKVTNAIS